MLPGQIHRVFPRVFPKFSAASSPFPGSQVRNPQHPSRWTSGKVLVTIRGLRIPSPLEKRGLDSSRRIQDQTHGDLTSSLRFSRNNVRHNLSTRHLSSRAPTRDHPFLQPRSPTTRGWQPQQQPNRLLLGSRRMEKVGLKTLPDTRLPLLSSMFLTWVLSTSHRDLR